MVMGLIILAKLAENQYILEYRIHTITFLKYRICTIKQVCYIYFEYVLFISDKVSVLRLLACHYADTLLIQG